MSTDSNGNASLLKIHFLVFFFSVVCTGNYERVPASGLPIRLKSKLLS